MVRFAGTQTGTTMTKPKNKTIRLTLEDQMLSRLEELVPMVADSAAAREFGVQVDCRTVARVALLRGLASMEAAVPQNTAQSAPEPTVAPPPPLFLPEVPETSPSSTADSDDLGASVDIELGDDGFIVAPDGWNSWSKSERVPEDQSGVHEYYKSGGWQRYWGHSGEEVIVFYWSPDPTKHDFPSYKNLDMNRKEIKVQDTPYGPGHLVPHGWSE